MNASRLLFSAAVVAALGACESVGIPDAALPLPEKAKVACGRSAPQEVVVVNDLDVAVNIKDHGTLALAKTLEPGQRLASVVAVVEARPLRKADNGAWFVYENGGIPFLFLEPVEGPEVLGPEGMGYAVSAEPVGGGGAFTVPVSLMCETEWYAGAPSKTYTVRLSARDAGVRMCPDSSAAPKVPSGC